MAAIESRIEEISDKKWNEVDNNVVSNLHLASFSFVQRCIKENCKGDLGCSHQIVRGQVTSQSNFLKEETLHSSNE